MGHGPTFGPTFADTCSELSLISRIVAGARGCECADGVGEAVDWVAGASSALEVAGASSVLGFFALEADARRCVKAF